MIEDKFQEKYNHFHMQILTADGKAIDFYKKVGLKKLSKLCLRGFIKVMNIIKYKNDSKSLERTN
tara:strand:- start:2132 stop:2326 length:195 start_codon:yes stop_codon:yes gene_type:complete